MDANDLTLLEQLGYEGVLAEMAKGEGRLGRPGSQLREEVGHWLKLKEAERALASAAKRDAREEATLSIAKEANTIASDALAAARSSARWAMWAAIIAAIAIVITAKDQILALIFGQP
jgi:hypothetical protein